VTLHDEAVDGEPLLEAVMRAGQRIRPSPSLQEVRQRAQRNLEQLPEHLRALDAVSDYPVEISPGVRAMAEQCDRTCG
jgi:nicotinate phosphoribosyltransferase